MVGWDDPTRQSDLQQMATSPASASAAATWMLRPGAAALLPLQLALDLHGKSLDPAHVSSSSTSQNDSKEAIDHIDHDAHHVHIENCYS
eukprot:6460795-Amphidinium_carterae.1